MIGRPCGPVSWVSVKCPIAIVIRYDAAGSASCQRVTVRPPAGPSEVDVDSIRPLATPTIVDGAEIEMS